MSSENKPGRLTQNDGRPQIRIGAERGSSRKILSGAQLPDGVYGFSVVATDDDEQTIDTMAASFGRVTGVEVVGNAPRLNIGELGVPFDAVFAVREDELGG